MRYFVKKITETGSMLDTDPSLYTGFEVDPVTGKAKKKGEDDEMSDLELHTKDGVPDDPKHPNINVQAEAYKPGFVISLAEVNPNHPLQDTSKRAHTASLIRVLRKGQGEKTPLKRRMSGSKELDAAAQGAFAATSNYQDPVAQTLANAADKSYNAGLSISRRARTGKGPDESVLDTLKAFQQIVQEDETIKMVWEDTTTGQKGDVTPALFVKVYSKVLVAEQAQEKEARPQSGSEQTPMSESKPNMALANELLSVGLVNNVKKTSEVLREENPMRKAMEIYYNSEKSNSNVDKKEYVPSVVKEGKAVLEKKSAPVVEAKPEEKPVAKKKNPIIW